MDSIRSRLSNQPNQKPLRTNRLIISPPKKMPPSLMAKRQHVNFS